MEPLAERPLHLPAVVPSHPGYTRVRVSRDVPVSTVVAPQWPRAVTDEQVQVNPRSERVSRVVNVALATTAVVALAPLFVAIGIAIRLTSPGPIVYRQTRVGLDRRRGDGAHGYDRRSVDLGGEVFSMYKFRTMTVDAEERGITWAARSDTRVTSVGRVLRKTRLDELPQLFNVIRGEMNIVGPRPERPSIFIQLRAQVHRYGLRQRAKPGITGLAQIRHGYDQSVADVRTKVAYDLAYLERQSLWMDLGIMVRTLPVMLFRRGAQ